MGLELGVIIAALSSLFGFSRLIGAKTKMEQSRITTQKAGIATPALLSRSQFGSAGLATVGMLGAAATGALLLSRRTKKAGIQTTQTAKNTLLEAVRKTLDTPKNLPNILFRLSRGRIGTAPQPRRRTLLNRLFGKK